MPFHNFDRLLFALRPPAGIAEYMAEEQARLGRGRLVRKDYLHITLGMADFPVLSPRALAIMREIGASIAASQFRVALGRMVGTRKSVALRPEERIEPLYCLRRHLVTGITRSGLLAERRGPFSPHVTLLYRNGEPFDREIDIISWMIEEFLLIHSRVGRTEHIVLDRWPLQGISSQSRERPVDRLLAMLPQERIGFGEGLAAEEAGMRR